MAWVDVPNNQYWEYDNAPADPGVDSPFYELWAKQSNGIRDEGSFEVYTKARKKGSTADTMGELNKTFFDNHPV